MNQTINIMHAYEMSLLEKEYMDAKTKLKSCEDHEREKYVYHCERLMEIFNMLGYKPSLTMH